MTVSAPKNADEFKANALAEYEKVFESGKIVSLIDSKKALREACGHQAEILDVANFTREFPEVFALPHLSLNGSGGTLGSVVSSGIGLSILRGFRDYATKRFVQQFEGRLPEIISELTDRSLATFSGRPAKDQVGHDQFNALSGLKIGLEAGIDRDFAVEAIQTLVAFDQFVTDVRCDLLSLAAAANVGRDIRQVGSLLTEWPDALDEVMPQQSLAI